MLDIRVLIIEDDEDDYFLLEDTLRNIQMRHFRVEWADSYQKGLEAIRAQQHDIYIIDYLLGAKNGVDLIREAVAMGCQQPMILLTGMENPEVDETAARIGASDYLIKGQITPDRVARSIRYSMAQAASAKALRENERKYRTIFEQSRDMIFVTDLGGNLQSVSKASEELTGYSPEELIGKRIGELYENPDDREEIRLQIGQTGEIVNREVGIRTKEGPIRHCSLNVKRHLDTNTGQAYLQGVLHDLTAEMREQQATLLSDKMEATGRLMRTLAHEVRNPLTNVNLALEGIISAELDPDHEVFDYVDIIRRNSTRISDLITQLLNAARPAELTLVPLSLRAVVEETVAEVRDRIELRKVTLLEKYGAPQDTVLLDVHKVKIAFTNILVNALEAMEEGEGILEVGLEHLPAQVRLYIRDNGVGIHPENIDRLFEPYFTSKKTGMGLGLASTLNILKSHNATVNVESTVGEGTTFWVTFPLLP